MVGVALGKTCAIAGGWVAKVLTHELQLTYAYECLCRGSNPVERVLQYTGRRWSTPSQFVIDT